MTVVLSTRENAYVTKEEEGNPVLFKEMLVHVQIATSSMNNDRKLYCHAIQIDTVGLGIEVLTSGFYAQADHWDKWTCDPYHFPCCSPGCKHSAVYARRSVSPGWMEMVPQMPGAFHHP